MSLYIGLLILYGSIPRRRLGKLQRLIEAAIEAEMFADLVDEVLAPNLGWICSVSQDNAAKPRDVEIASDIVRVDIHLAKAGQLYCNVKTILCTPYAAATECVSSA